MRSEQPASGRARDDGRERQALLARIAEGASARERDREAPFALVRLLADAGLGAVRLPVEFGGAGFTTREFFKFLIDLAQADSNVAQILRAHYGFVEGLLLTPSSQTRDRWLERIAAGAVIGSAISELSTAQAGDLTAFSTTFTPNTGGFLINGTKYYSTGTLYSDYVWVWGATADGLRASAVVETDRAGVEILDDWDGFGQRLTATGTTHFRDVRVELDEVTLIDPGNPPPRVPNNAYFQLFLSAVIAGNLRAVEDDAIALLHRRKRGFTHGASALPREDPNLLQIVGEIAADAYAAEATVMSAADVVGAALQGARPGGDRSVSAEEASKAAAKAKIVVDRLGQHSAAQLFEVGGASATRSDVNLDRHWRNIRTLASHNPTVLKSRAIGDLLVNGTALPDNTFF